MQLRLKGDTVAIARVFHAASSRATHALERHRSALDYVARRLLSLFRTAFSVLSGRFFSLALFIVSARLFSPAENASFIYAITLPQLLIQLGTLGWLNLIRKEVSRRSELPPALFKGFVIRSLQIPLAAILLTSGCVALVPVFMGTDTVFMYSCAAVVTMVYAINALMREYLVALGTPAFGIFAAESVPFLFASGALWLIRPTHADAAILLFLLGLSLACVLQIPAVIKALRPHLKAGKPVFHTREWLRTGGHSLLGFGGRAILDRLDTLTLATLAPAVEFAYYNSAQRITGLLMLAPVVLIPVFSPHLSKAFSANNTPLLRREMVTQTFVVCAGVLPLAALMLIAPASLMSQLYGEDYRASAHVFSLIAFSQTMFALSLPWSNLTLMCDREKLYGYAHIAALLLILPIALGLVQDWRAMAVAISVLIANAFLFFVFFSVGLYDLMLRAERRPAP